MTTRLTLFTATLVQDSAMSISGVDRESTADRPFAIVDGVPVLSGRGLKGAAVAMARRFFRPLPRSVSDDASRGKALHRSAWEFSNATPLDAVTSLRPRAGVGILQKTGARASGVLYDLETVPAGTHWPLVLRMDWSWAGKEGSEAEGILGYVLARHWAERRCWLGGDVARGLGWCHIENELAFRLNEQEYETWVTSGRKTLPRPLPEVPRVEPTHSWSFRTLEVKAAFGEYRPNGDQEPAWGLDMLSVGTHNADRSIQSVASGIWARPSWMEGGPAEVEIGTDRSIAMGGTRPLLPGASVRGPMRHAFSRAARAHGQSVQDPHLVQGDVSENDPAGKIFGSVAHSSRVLICDALAQDGWAAARLHMHAEDEFSAGSYGSAKRDAVRILRGDFPVRIVAEGAGIAEVEALTSEIDKLVAIGALGHLPLGGHKTHGAGWGRWKAGAWRKCDVVKARDWTPPVEAQDKVAATESRAGRGQPQTRVQPHRHETAWALVRNDSLKITELTLENAASAAGGILGDYADKLVAWWCEPTIDVTAEPPEIFGWGWPKTSTLRVDEVVFFFERGSWRAARTASGVRWVLIQELASAQDGAEQVEVLMIPARLHGDTTRFAAKSAGKDSLFVRKWRSGVTPVGFTLNKGDR